MRRIKVIIFGIILCLMLSGIGFMGRSVSAAEITGTVTYEPATTSLKINVTQQAGYTYTLTGLSFTAVGSTTITGTLPQSSQSIPSSGLTCSLTKENIVLSLLALSDTNCQVTFHAEIKREGSGTDVTETLDSSPATFYKVTVSGEHGTVSLKDGEEGYSSEGTTATYWGAADETVSLTATPEDGYIFSKWSADLNGLSSETTANTTYTIKAEESGKTNQVTAAFTVKPGSVTLTADKQAIGVGAGTTFDDQISITGTSGDSFTGYLWGSSPGGLTFASDSTTALSNTVKAGSVPAGNLSTVLVTPLGGSVPDPEAGRLPIVIVGITGDSYVNRGKTIDLTCSDVDSAAFQPYITYDTVTWDIVDEKGNSVPSTTAEFLDASGMGFYRRTLKAGNSAELKDYYVTVTYKEGTVEKARAVHKITIREAFTETLTIDEGSISMTADPPYITAGYPFDLVATLDPNYGQSIKWYINNKQAAGTTLSGKVKSLTINSGNAADIRYTYEDGGKLTPVLAESYDSEMGTLEDYLEVEVYRAPTVSYDKKEMKISGKLPDKAAKATVAVAEVTGGYYQYVYDGKVVASSSVNDLTLNSTSIPYSTLNSAIQNNKPDDDTYIEVQLYPTGDGEDGDEIKGTSAGILGTDRIPVRSATVHGDGIQSSTYYGIEGSTTSITANVNSGYTFDRWDIGDRSTNRTLSYKFGDYDGDLKALTKNTNSSSASTSSSSSGGGMPATGGDAGGSGYDSVPKTGEGNIFLYLLLGTVVFGGFGAYAMTRAMRETANGAAAADKAETAKAENAENDLRSDE